ncbi:cytochrome P450 [Engelhardtia mirabilis]|uniref:Cytochrome P450 n=1 Tax=Engelhardtia mirabilis TaxID=2528011 RepID=A0A518BET0_9BACT|nr:Cytochrome P450 [Planctomycetes bacterium Pla133]QDU99719.1 Cytochrome P450 [Planctomycetes bacterium Pla86]
MDPIRRAAHVVTPPFMWLAMQLKLFAYRQPLRPLRWVLLELTQVFDFAMVFANVQNYAMSINHRLFGGDFLFGKAVMVTGHARALEEIPHIRLRGSRFMGVPMVAGDPGVFVTNAGPITTSQPARRVLREHMNREIVSDWLTSPDYPTLQARCADILADWKASPQMASMFGVRGTSTRIMVRLLSGQDLPAAQAEAVTRAYFFRFGEHTLFGYYAPFVLGLLGTRERMRRDAYRPLQDLGIDELRIDMVLFAAMFSLGTIVIKCLEYARRYDVDWSGLTHDERVRFVIETQRLYPTVTSVHRILERPEEVVIRGKRVRLYPGEEIAYPFVAINRDPAVFAEPDEFRLDRPQSEVDAVLSWSTGFHACPVKDLSILVTVLQLDALAERGDLRALSFFNIEV